MLYIHMSDTVVRFCNPSGYSLARDPALSTGSFIPSYHDGNVKRKVYIYVETLLQRIKTFFMKYCIIVSCAYVKNT